jgi:hypothetical protein
MLMIVTGSKAERSKCSIRGCERRSDFAELVTRSPRSAVGDLGRVAPPSRLPPSFSTRPRTLASTTGCLLSLRPHRAEPSPHDCAESASIGARTTDRRVSTGLPRSRASRSLPTNSWWTQHRVDRTNHLVHGNERDARDLGRPVETRRSVVRTPTLAVSAQSSGEGSARRRRKDSRHPVIDRQRSRSRRNRRWLPRLRIADRDEADDRHHASTVSDQGEEH